MGQVADELRMKKTALNNLAESIVTKREALIKAQEGYKAALEIAQSEEPQVAELLKRHAELQQEAVAASLSSGSGTSSNPPSRRPSAQSSAASEDGGGIGGFFGRFRSNDNAESQTQARTIPSSMAL